MMTQAKLPSKRDLRLDVLRGLCLVMIFINHVPGNPFETWTSRNFGFSDAAEGFVMMAGMAAGLAYGMDFRLPGRIWTGVARMWRRAWTLYLVHVACSFIALAGVCAVVLLTDNLIPLSRNEMNHVFSNPLETLVGLVLMSHQFGYMNVLPLYAALLFFAPPVIWAGWRWPRAVMAGSVALWFASSIFYLHFPKYPLPGSWFFNPFAWQILFVTGLLTGLALKQGKRFVPVTPWLFWPALFWVIYCALAVQIPAMNHLTSEFFWMISRTGAPWQLHVFDKTFVSLPRLSHIMALAYVLSVLPVVARACASRYAAPLALLGRQALPVFALGSVLSLVLQAVKDTTGQDFWLDTGMVFGGLALQWALAAAREYWPKPPKLDGRQPT